MKTKRHIVAILATLALGVTGCNDADFLKEKPATIYTLNNSFNTISQVEACVTNQYLHIRYWYQNTFFMKGIGADVLDAPYWRCSGSGASDFTKWSATYGETNNIYNAFYQLISYANQTLMGTEASNLTWDNQAQRASIIAQSKFFRGYAYLSLGEMFGGVPLVEEFYQTPKYDFVRSSREETYEFAIRDLTEAANALPNYPEKAGLVAKGAAYHFLAEAYLALATIKNNDATLLAEAERSANKVMELHQLMTSRFGTRANAASKDEMGGVAAYYPNGDVFFDLFQRGNLDYTEGNTEALWTLQNDVKVWHDYGGDQYLSYPRNFSPVFRDAIWKEEYKESGAAASPWNGDIDQTLYPGGNTSAYIGGKGVSFTAPTKYVVNGIWAGNYANDMRNSSVNIRRNFVCLDRKHSMYGKVVPESMLAASNIDRYYPIWTKFAPIDDNGYEAVALGYGTARDNMYRDEYACRLGETYLLRAEIYLRMGSNQKAADDINTLRTRAQCSYKYTAADVSITSILNERARELFMEERRWCTLLRMGGTVVADQLKNHSMYIADYNTYKGEIKWNLFPFPQSVIDANLGATIDQNPAW